MYYSIQEKGFYFLLILSLFIVKIESENCLSSVFLKEECLNKTICVNTGNESWCACTLTYNETNFELSYCFRNNRDCSIFRHNFCMDIKLDFVYVWLYVTVAFFGFVFSIFLCFCFCFFCPNGCEKLLTAVCCDYILKCLCCIFIYPVGCFLTAVKAICCDYMVKCLDCIFKIFGELCLGLFRNLILIITCKYNEIYDKFCRTTSSSLPTRRSGTQNNINPNVFTINTPNQLNDQIIEQIIIDQETIQREIDEKHLKRRMKKTIVSEPSIEKIIKNNDDDLPICAICLTSLKNETVKTISCGHTFHQHCIDDWFKENPNNPSCPFRCKKNTNLGEANITQF